MSQIRYHTPHSRIAATDLMFGVMMSSADAAGLASQVPGDGGILHGGHLRAGPTLDIHPGAALIPLDYAAARPTWQALRWEIAIGLEWSSFDNPAVGHVRVDTVYLDIDNNNPIDTGVSGVFVRNPATGDVSMRQEPTHRIFGAQLRIEQGVEVEAGSWAAARALLEAPRKGCPIAYVYVVRAAEAPDRIAGVIDARTLLNWALPTRRPQLVYPQDIELGTLSPDPGTAGIEIKPEQWIGVGEDNGVSGSPTTLRIQGMRLAGTQPPNGVVRYVDAYGACRVVRPGQVLAEDFVFTAAERAVWLTTRGSTEAFLGGVECELRVTNLSDPPGDWAQIGTVEASGSGDLTWSWEWKDWDRHREERVHLRLRRVSNQGADVARTRTVEIQAYGEDFRPFRGEVAVEVSLLDVDDPTAYGDSTINLVDPTDRKSVV